MRQSHLTRLRRLEGLGKGGRQYGQVVWLGLDGRPEEPLEAVDPARPLIVLPRKAPDAETWAQWVRQRFPQYGGAPDDEVS